MTDLSDMTGVDLANAVSTYRVTLAAAYADVMAIHTDAKGTAAIKELGLQVKQLVDLASEAAARAAKGQEVTEAMAERARQVYFEHDGGSVDSMRAALTAALNGEEG